MPKEVKTELVDVDAAEEAIASSRSNMLAYQQQQQVAEAKSRLRGHPEPLHEIFGREVRTPPPRYGARGFQPPTTSSPLGARCGEIFVAKNANKWTFLCTFCNKTTRDIGNFVLHCSRHIQEQEQMRRNNGYGEGVMDVDGSHQDFYAARAVNDDYLDCSSYLDVNVTTEADAEQNLEDPLKTEQPEEAAAASSPLEAKIKVKHVQLLRAASPKRASRNDRAPLPDPGRKRPAAVLPAGRSRASPWPSPENGLKAEPDDDYKDATFTPTGRSTRERRQRRQVRGPAYCDLCQKKFQYYSLYRNHMIKHTTDTPFKCEKCDKSFKSKQALRYHEHTHQRDKRYNCPICRQGMSSEQQYIQHMMTHEDASTFPCIMCGTVLASQKERDAHLETHSKDRPYSCGECGKLFRLRHHLSNHMRMHNQYCCQYCKTTFTSLSHIRKPYVCDPCLRLPADMRSVKAAKQEMDTSPEESADSGDEQGGVADPDAEMLLVDSNDSQGGAPAQSVRFSCDHCPRTYSHMNGLKYQSHVGL